MVCVRALWSPTLDPMLMKRNVPKPCGSDQSSVTLTLYQLVSREGRESLPRKMEKIHMFAGNCITVILVLSQFSPEPRMR